MQFFEYCWLERNIMQADDFVDSVKSLSFPNTFNPYIDTCPIFDMKTAAHLRLEVLRCIVTMAVNRDIDSIWIGRDLGHRGGRRTGLALTDDCHVVQHGQRWNVTSAPVVKGVMYSEMTAKVIWNILNDVKDNVFLWNVFPLHPHNEDNVFSNRQHNKAEHIVGEDILDQLITLLNPKRLIAIGNDAKVTGERLCGDREFYTVRHPSHGGQKKFQGQMRELYSLVDPQLNLAGLGK